MMFDDKTTKIYINVTQQYILVTK